MATLLQRGKDNLTNGVILGGIAGALIIWGDTVKGWVTDIIPQSWINVFPEGYGLAIILIGLGALVGYIVDRQ